MAEQVDTSRIRLERVKGPLRHAYIHPFPPPLRFGVHGAIKSSTASSRRRRCPPRSTTGSRPWEADCWVRLPARWARQIPSGAVRMKATVEGAVGALHRVLRITAIRVRYELRVPAGKRGAAERAVATYEQKCPAATSVRDCIPIAITADIREE